MWACHIEVNIAVNMLASSSHSQATENDTDSKQPNSKGMKQLGVFYLGHEITRHFPSKTNIGWRIV